MARISKPMQEECLVKAMQCLRPVYFQVADPDALQQRLASLPSLSDKKAIVERMELFELDVLSNFLEDFAAKFPGTVNVRLISRSLRVEATIRYYNAHFARGLWSCDEAFQPMVELVRGCLKAFCAVTLSASFKPADMRYDYLGLRRCRFMQNGQEREINE